MLFVLLQSSTLGAPPPLLKRFTATMYSDQSETDSLHVTTTSSVLVYEGAESTPTGGSIGVVQTSSPLIDRRVTTAAGWYAANLSDTASLARTGVYAHTPFFEYQTCDIFSIPFVGPPNDYHEETFAQAWESLFNVDFSGIYAGASSTGRVMTIGDASCDVWRFNTSNGGLVTNALFCLKMVRGSSSALLLSLNYSQVEGTAFFKNSTNVLTHVAAVTALPQRPTAAAHCVDLRPPTFAASALTTHERVNDEARIATINAAAKGAWRARASSHFSSATTVAELNARLMPSRPAHRQAGEFLVCHHTPTYQCSLTLYVARRLPTNSKHICAPPSARRWSPQRRRSHQSSAPHSQQQRTTCRPCPRRVRCARAVGGAVPLARHGPRPRTLRELLGLRRRRGTRRSTLHRQPRLMGLRLDRDGTAERIDSNTLVTRVPLGLRH